MGDANPAAEAGIGAEALLGLAAGRSSVRLPRFSALPDHAAERAGPEPPPLQLPTPAAPAPPLYPAVQPSLALPMQHAQQAHSARSHLLSAPPLPPTHELPTQPASSFLPPAPKAQDLPGIASISGWAPPEHPQYAAIPTPTGTAYDPIRQQEAERRRLAPLPGSDAILSQPEAAAVSSAAVHGRTHLAAAAPWQHPHQLHAAQTLPPASAPPEYALPPPAAGQWPPPHGQHVAYPYPPHATTSSYYYYASAPAATPPHLQHQHAPVHVAPYSLAPPPPPPHGHQPHPVIPPPLTIPLSLPRTSSAEPPPALGAKVPSVHDIQNMRPLSALDSKYLGPKDQLMVTSQVPVANVGKVPGLTPSFPDLRLGAGASDGPLQGQTSRQTSVGCEDRKEEKPPKRKGGLADLMNPTDKMPGDTEESEAVAVGMKGLTVQAQKVDNEIRIVADSSTTPKSTDLADVKEEKEVIDADTQKGTESVSSAKNKEKEAEPHSETAKEVVDERRKDPLGDMEESVDNRRMDKEASKDAKEVQSVRDVSDVQEVQEVKSAADVTDTKDDTDMKDEKSAVDVDVAENVTGVAGVAGVTDVKVADVAEAADVDVVDVVEDVEDQVKEVEEVGDQVEEVEEVEDVEDVQRVADVEEVEDGSADSEETRCPCGSTDNSGFMIACDECNTWQHGKCMGFRRSTEVPNVYFCHICRPDEVRHNCIAHPRYRDKHGAKEKDRKEPKRELDVLAGVKPLELRKHFVADLKQKRTGARLSKSDLFYRYATLLNNQFIKSKQSVVDGLVVLLDMQKGDVAAKLESTLKRIRNGADKGSEDSERRRGSSEASQAAANDHSGARAPGSARSNPQKRARPSSLSLENSDVGNAIRADPQSSDGAMDIDALGIDGQSSRGMTREERKLQQTMKLFARMEEREREKKKPRTLDASSSPRAGHLPRPKTPRSATRPKSVSPKLSSLSTPPKQDDIKTILLSSAGKEAHRTEVGESKGQITEHTASVEVQNALPKQQDIESVKVVPDGASVEIEPPREQPKQEKDAKTRDKPERILSHRKDLTSPDANLSIAGRRKGLLDRERSQERKRRRLGVSSREMNAHVPSTTDGTRDESLEFKLSLPGPSVLGSRRVIPSRCSELEKERHETDDAALERFKQARLPQACRKEWILADKPKGTRRSGTVAWRMQSPTKKRYRPLEERLAAMSLKSKQDNLRTAAKTEPAQQSSTFSVSMIVVSEKGNLPDKGQKLEASRLILRSADNKPESEEKVRDRDRRLCIKKRPRMYAKVESENLTMKDHASPPKQEKPVTPTPASPQAAQTPSSKSPASPVRVRSPMLRSSPVPSANLRLRSASPPAIGKIPSFPLRSLSPTAKMSPQMLSTSLSPKLQPSEVPQDRIHRVDIVTSVPPSKEGVRSESRAVSSKENISVRGIPLSKPKPPQAAPAGGAVKTSPRISSGQLLEATPIPSLLGLRSIRSVPITEARMPDSKNALANGVRREGREEMNDGSALLSPNPSNSGEISDIFQQRLQGFLKPSAVSPRETSNGLPSTPNALSSAKVASNNAASPVTTNGPLRGAPNGVARSPMLSYRGKPAEQNGSWRSPAYGMGKRPIIGPSAVKTTPQNGPPVHSGRISPNSGDKGHFRSSRSEPSGRVDDHQGRGRVSGPPWGGHSQRNGWIPGSGRGGYISKENNLKSSRRGRF